MAGFLVDIDYLDRPPVEHVMLRGRVMGILGQKVKVIIDGRMTVFTSYKEAVALGRYLQTHEETA